MAQSNAYYDTMLKDLIRINKDFKRKYDQDIENLVATQRTIYERVAGNRSVIELNYQEIIKNRKEILENRRVIMNGIEDIQEKLASIEGKLTPT